MKTWRGAGAIGLVAAMLLGSYSHAQELEEPFFLRCESHSIDMIFALDPKARTVRNLTYHQDMVVGYWGEATINTQFPFSISLSDLVSGTRPSTQVSVNFDRMRGTALFAGTVASPDDALKQFPRENNEDGDRLVTDFVITKCHVVDKQF